MGRELEKDERIRKERECKGRIRKPLLEYLLRSTPCRLNFTMQNNISDVKIGYEL